MIKLIEKTNLNINSWLINWGLMSGYLKNGVIHSTKFGVVFCLFAFCLNTFSLIKWTIFLFSAKDALLTHYLGDWGIFYAPKLVIDLFSAFCFIYLESVIMLFHYSLKDSNKMFYWLEQMEFDSVNRCFTKLNLNESDSKKFINRISLLRFNFISFIHSFVTFFVISSCFSLLKRSVLKPYYAHYIISILIFAPQLYLSLSYTCGLLIIFYQVR